MQCFAAGNKPLRHRAAFTDRKRPVNSSGVVSGRRDQLVVLPGIHRTLPGLKDAGWVDPDYIGIDEGPILAMIENYRSELIWCVMRGDPYLRQGLERAGFSGGWLESGQRSTSAGRACSCASRASCVP